MMDYIAWLLHGQEEEEEESNEKAVLPEPYLPLQRRKTEKKPQKETLSVETLSTQEEILPASEDKGEAPELGEGLASELWKQELPFFETKRVALEMLKSKAEGSEKGAVALYRQVENRRQEASFFSYGGTEKQRPFEEMESSFGEGMTVEELDRCFERDARRYDGGFTIL